MESQGVSMALAPFCCFASKLEGVLQPSVPSLHLSGLNNHFTCFLHQNLFTPTPLFATSHFHLSPALPA